MEPEKRRVWQRGAIGFRKNRYGYQRAPIGNRPGGGYHPDPMKFSFLLK
jgi:hypothetical protein